MVYIFFYKLACLTVGLVVIILGYRLFVKGLYRNSGEIEGVWKEFKIVVRKATAGTYLVLFGSVVITFTIYKGFSVDEKEGRKVDRPKTENFSLDSIKMLDDSLKRR